MQKLIRQGKNNNQLRLCETCRVLIMNGKSLGNTLNVMFEGVRFSASDYEHTTFTVNLGHTSGRIQNTNA
mgnify:CR=1 FL=1